MEYYQEIKWHEHAEHIINTQKNIYLTLAHADVLICSGDKRAKAHRLILTLCSDFFYDIFKDYPTTQETATIIIPELDNQLIDPLIAFMYTGQVSISDHLVADFVNACKLLKLKCVILYSKLNEKKSEIEYLTDSVSHSQDIITDTIETYDENIVMDEEYVVENTDLIENQHENTESQEEHFAESLLTVDDIDPIRDSPIPDDEQSATIEVLYNSDVEDDDIDNVDEIENESSGEFEDYDEMKEFKIAIDPDPNQLSYEHQEDAKKKSPRKFYTESTLLDAFNDLANGATILDTSKKYNVPRSTLYCKIRSNTRYSYLFRSIRASAIQDATNAVVKNNLSLQQAASQFGIAKTVLWRRLRQSNLYKPEDKSHAFREQAIKAIEDGEKLLNVSKMYNIPISTLHRDKVKLMEQGKLPKNCTVVKREVGPEFKKRIEAALQSCRNGMTQKMASELHNVPKTTIWRYVNSKSCKTMGLQEEV